MQKPFRLLILGAYGVFGTQITESLCQESNVDIFVAGRNLEKAQALLNKLSNTAAANLNALAIDAKSSEFSQTIQKLHLDLVINTCGPFQGQDYSIAKACISNAIDYLDLADGRDFVCNIHNLNDIAKKNQCLVISGASSVPGLSSAVVAEYKNMFSHLQEIESYILPGNKSEHGEATVASVLSYTGKPIKVWQNKKWTKVYGWQDIQRVHLKDLGKRWSGNCEVPDLELFPKYYPELQSVKFQAGSELSIMHLGLWLLSGLSRMKLIANWSRFSKMFTRMTHWFLPFGTETGGMIIKLNGINHQSQALSHCWQLIAKDGDGPKIPVIPAIILAKKIINKKISLCGAMPCMEMVSIKEFEYECRELSITQISSQKIS